MTIRTVTTKAELAACFAIRRSVFIEEQDIPESEEWDETDLLATHFIAEDEHGPAATARLYRDGDMARVGRVAVLLRRRGTGLGARMMEAAIDHARNHGFAGVVLDAQIRAIPFYTRLGFAAEGPEFDDGSGIMHRRMTRRFQPENSPA